MLEVLDKMPNPPAIMVYGAPGIGKTSILGDFAKSKKYDLRVKHLSRMDATDWSGIPKIGDNQKYTEFMPISIFKPLPEGKKKIVVFFDELNTATPQVLNAALDIILEKKGEGAAAVLPENTIILAAGNLGDEDGTYVEELSAAVKTRMIQVKMNSEPDEWLKWAKSKSINRHVIKFIEDNNNYLLDLEGFKTGLDQVATPRGWERVSNLLDCIDLLPTKYPLLEKMITGTIGKKTGKQFFNYLTNMLSSQNYPENEWRRKITEAEILYTKQTADYTPQRLTELTILVNEGLKQGYANAKEKANKYIEFMNNEIGQNVFKAKLTSLSGLDLQYLINYAAQTGNEKLLNTLREAK